MPPTRRIPVDWSDEQKREFCVVAQRCLAEHAAAFCTIAIVLKTSHHISKAEAALPHAPARGRGVAL